MLQCWACKDRVTHILQFPTISFWFWMLLPAAISEKLPFLTCTKTSRTSLCPFSIVYSINIKRGDLNLLLLFPEHCLAVVDKHLSPTGACFLWDNENQPFFLRTISITFFSRQFFAFVMCYKSWEKLAKVRASAWSLKWCKSRLNVAPQLAQILRFISALPPQQQDWAPSLLGRQWESGCFLPFWAEEDQINKKFTINLPVIHHSMQKGFFLSGRCEQNPASLHFSDALD